MLGQAGRLTPKIAYEKPVRESVAKTGVDRKGLNDETLGATVRINKQVLDNAGGARAGKNDLQPGAGERKIILGYACNEVKDGEPLAKSMATQLSKKLTDVNVISLLWWLRPD